MNESKKDRTPVDVKEKAAAREQRTRKHWTEENTFPRSVQQREGAPRFVLYEGPPTANGAPHIGHVLGRVIKDFIGRYKTMTGYQVVRKAGWDTHGLPVELGVEKELGISGKQQIEAYGVEPFIEKCKESVFRYEQQWRELTEAIGYWTDLDAPYLTLSNDYIESVWHILSDIHGKGLLTKGHRVSPYCPSCQTTLSSHELAQGYEQVKDLSATVEFKDVKTGEYFLAWTTTPWTLPANVALAVHPELDYVKAKQDNKVYIVAKSRASQVLSGEYEVVSEHKGSEFTGKTYAAPYPSGRVKSAYRVIAADFVSDASGTGIVHIAPAHGEDDYRAAQRAGIDMLQIVGLDGCYLEDAGALAGRFVKDCDLDIIKDLAARKLLFAKEKIEHSYPFCWRCKTPLLYYALDSWFIRTTAVRDQLLANNRTVEWYPPSTRDGRFGKFLEELVDWNVSRNRYWGTPLNVWICKACEHELVPDSIAALRSHAAKPLPEPLDLHKPYVDGIELSCPACEGGKMIRTPEVIDVWFDSGSMPFAQHHYPFENKSRAEEQFPADIICEGIDQTRGWFYSLLAVSTMYTGRAPYKAVIATGHILDENGQKMSKSKGNVVDPWEIIDQFGADAFRWALLSDSAPWSSKRFSRTIVAEAKSKVIDTLMNAFAFYSLYASIDGFVHHADTAQAAGTAQAADAAQAADPGHAVGDAEQSGIRQVLDRWILSRLNGTIMEVRTALESYDFMKAAQTLEELVDDFSNWYIRRSRERFWGSGLSADKLAAYETTHRVLTVTSQLIAPFAPFLSDDLYRGLTDGGSVHLTDFPEPEEAEIDSGLEREMGLVRQVVELARSVRNETGLKNRQPLAELIVVSDVAHTIQPYAEIIRDELNVKSVRLEKQDSDLTEYTLKLNLKLAGPKYGRRVVELQEALQALRQQDIEGILQHQQWSYETIAGETLVIPVSELLIERQAASGYSSASAGAVTVALNTEITEELAKEGFVREVIRGVQDLRKQQGLPVEKRINLVLYGDEGVQATLEQYRRLLEENVLTRTIQFQQQDGMAELQVEDKRVYVFLG
ncbi:isoleucine--tRNA ligase [Paenibacillus senegalensis]|uniref:isoleucine--tRNA ligase n=1 Tax=Paenibacillus senegalensis TaxID=1465766 RepID=UPI000287CC87|nr:isoleucine--tRNA ligase [Paenibacillus senegalensis]